MFEEPRSAKKRRTDNGPLTAEELAYANSTIRLFTGNRQNRWMQGYTQPSAPVPPNVRNGPSRAAAQHPRPASPPAIPMSAGTVSEQPLVDLTSQSTDPEPHTTQKRVSSSAAARTRQQRQEKARASSIPKQTQATAQPSHANLVAYESPYEPLTTATVSTANLPHAAHKSMDHPARPFPPQGLPSPARTDGMSSPITAPNQQAAPVVWPYAPPPSGARSRPVSMDGTQAFASHFQQSNDTSPMMPMSHAHPSMPHPPAQRRTASTSSAGPPPGIPLPAHPDAQQGQMSPMVAPQSQPGGDPHMQSLRRQLDHFRSTELPKQKFSEIDTGRLALLREAITKGDWFYVVLSQIHALSEAPDLMPVSAKNITREALQKIDKLLCSNDRISKVHLTWLWNFPASPIQVYSTSSQAAAGYEAYVQRVANFIEQLPTTWERLEKHCQAVNAPPLVEDLVSFLGLTSPVLQAVVFRLFCRELYFLKDSTASPVGLPALEHLHSMDQEFARTQPPRTEHERMAAYKAFERVAQECVQHDDRARRHDQTQSRLPELERRPFPQFALPQDALAPFVVNPKHRTPKRTHSQHQHTIAQNNQPLAYPRHSHPAFMPQSAPAIQQNIYHDWAAYLAPGLPHSSQAGLPPQDGTTFAAKSNPLLPTAHEPLPRPQPTHPDPMKSALHQIHLRSPILGPTNTKRTSGLYRYVQSFVQSPHKIDIKKSLMVPIAFNLSQEYFNRIPRTTPASTTVNRAQQSLTLASLTYRLRCCAITLKGFPNPQSWVTSDCVWPEDLFLDFNSHILEPRKKLQHGRYLSIDLTTKMQVGRNVITAAVNRISTDTRPFEFALAVEVIGVMAHDTILTDLRKVTAAKSLNDIKASLSSKGNDDEVSFVSSNLTINLFDPITSSKIFDIPVRGLTCAHKDCFDLETFLSTRPREHSAWPTVVDCWRCPICRGDVRPQMLIEDGFLVEVRKTLAEKGLLDTRAIVVKEDGAWAPKEEETKGVRSPSLEREEQENKPVTITHGPTTAVVVIEID